MTVIRLPFYLIFLGANSGNAPSLELTGDEAPTIDIFVLHCGEGAPLISDTLRAACSQDYPTGRSRVILLDDSCSEEVQEAVNGLKKEFPHIYYSTRGTRPRTHARAGNMNHGLEFVSTLPGGASEFVAFLDADNIPELCWLRRMFPHLLADPKVGAACPAARAYNIPPKDSIHISKEAHLYYEMILPALSAAKRDVIIGTGFVARRAAIDNLGGIPVQSLNDDGLMTIEMKARGWKLVWVQEYLQWNMVVETLHAQIKQRSRWNAGLQDTGLYAATTKQKHWTPELRFSSILPSVLFAPSTILLIPLSTVLLPLLWMTQVPLIQPGSAKVQILFYLGLIDLVGQFIHGAAFANLCERPSRSFTCVDKVWVYSYFLPALYDHWKPKKKVATGFHGAANAGASGQARQTVKPKQPPTPFAGTALNLSAFALLSVSFLVTIGRFVTEDKSSASRLILGPGWPPLVLIGGIYLSDTVTFALAWLNPPEELHREDLLVRDSTTGLAYPTKEAQERYDGAESQAKWLRLALFLAYCAWAATLV